MIDYKESDERYQISKIDEEEMIECIEVLKLRKLSSQNKKYDLKKDSDEINQMDMSDDKKPDERDQIRKNDEEKKTENIEVLKLGKLSSQKNLGNIEKYCDKIIWMDISDDMKSNERNQISKNDKVKVSDVIELLKLRKLILQKNIDNVEKESDEGN